MVSTSQHEVEMLRLFCLDFFASSDTVWKKVMVDLHTFGLLFKSESNLQPVTCHWSEFMGVNLQLMSEWAATSFHFITPVREFLWNDWSIAPFDVISFHVCWFIFPLCLISTVPWLRWKTNNSTAWLVLTYNFMDLLADTLSEQYWNVRRLKLSANQIIPIPLDTGHMERCHLSHPQLAHAWRHIHLDFWSRQLVFFTAGIHIQVRCNLSLIPGSFVCSVTNYYVSKVFFCVLSSFICLKSEICFPLCK